MKNNKLIGILIGLTVGLLVHLSLRLFFSYEFISFDQASIKIKNDSGHMIKTAVLRHKSGTLQSNSLYDGGEVRFIFPNRGENSYNLTVTLDNDSVLISQDVYFELGYRGTETVTNSKIITTNNWTR